MSQQDRDWVWHLLLPSLAVGQIAALYSATRYEVPADATRWVVVCLVGLVLGGWTLLCVWTWHRLLRRRDPGTGRVVYEPGVLGWGLPMWVRMAILSAGREAGSQTDYLSAQYIGSILRHLVVGFPIALWGGVLFGRSWEYLFGRFFSSSK